MSSTIFSPKEQNIINNQIEKEKTNQLKEYLQMSHLKIGSPIQNNENLKLNSPTNHGNQKLYAKRKVQINSSTVALGNNKREF